MNFTKILLISFSLAADAFAVSLCKGITTKELTIKKCLKVGIFFGLLQALMPLLGFVLGSSVYNILNFIGHYVVFFFLVVIGAGMLYDAFCGEEKKYIDDFSFLTLFLLGVATSIDAFSVGISFAFLEIKLYVAVATIGLVAFILSSLGVYIGSKFGKDNSKKAKVVGGIILIILAIELLIEHLL